MLPSSTTLAAMPSAISSGTRVAVAYQNENKLLGQLLYYLLTTGAGKQTLGEEYYDITQHADCFSRPWFHRDLNDDATISNNEVQSSSGAENSSFLNSRVFSSALSRLKSRFTGMWLTSMQIWPSVFPLVRELFALVLRMNLMFFYFEGLYFHLSKRAVGIRYMFIGKPTNQRPRYQIFGVFLLVQLCIFAAEGLRRSNLSSFATSLQPTSVGSYQTPACCS